MEKWWFSAIFLKPERANNDFLLFLMITRTQPTCQIFLQWRHKSSFFKNARLNVRQRCNIQIVIAPKIKIGKIAKVQQNKHFVRASNC